MRMINYFLLNISEFLDNRMLIIAMFIQMHNFIVIIISIGVSNNTLDTTILICFGTYNFQELHVA